MSSNPASPDFFHSCKVSCITAVVNHVFIFELIERKDKKRKKTTRKRMFVRNPGGEKLAFFIAVYLRSRSTG